MVLHGIALHLMIVHSPSCHCIVSYGVAWYCIVGFGARAVSRKTPIYFMVFIIWEWKFISDTCRYTLPKPQRRYEVFKWFRGEERRLWVEEEERSFQLDGDCGRLSRPVAAHHHFSSSAILHLTSHHTTDTVYILSSNVTFELKSAEIPCQTQTQSTRNTLRHVIVVNWKANIHRP